MLPLLLQAMAATVNIIAKGRSQRSLLLCLPECLFRSEMPVKSSSVVNQL